MWTKFYIYILPCRVHFFLIIGYAKVVSHFNLHFFWLEKRLDIFKYISHFFLFVYPHPLPIFMGVIITAFYHKLSSTIWFVTCEYIKIKYNAYFIFLYIMICHYLSHVVHLRWYVLKVSRFYKYSQTFSFNFMISSFFEHSNLLIYMQCIFMLVHSRDITFCFVIPKWLTSEIKGDR